MAIFNSYVKLPEGIICDQQYVYDRIWDLSENWEITPKIAIGI